MAKRLYLKIIFLILLNTITYSAVAVEWSGLLEMEALASKAPEQAGQTNLSHASLELGLVHQMSKDQDLEVVFLYEDEGTGEGQIDHAVVHFYNVVDTFELTVGQQYLSFGQFATNMINDPLTLELAETREAAVYLKTTHLPVNFGAGFYKGEVEHVNSEWLPDWLITASYEYKSSVELLIDAFFTNELSNSNNLREILLEEPVAQRVSGSGIALQLGYKDNLLDAECITATQRFSSGVLANQRPMACHIELARQFTMMANKWMVAAGYSNTRDALALDLPRYRTSLGLSTQAAKNVTLGLEWAVEKGYDIESTDAGKRAQAVIAQLGVEF